MKETISRTAVEAFVTQYYGISIDEFLKLHSKNKKVYTTIMDRLVEEFACAREYHGYLTTYNPFTLEREMFSEISFDSISSFEDLMKKLIITRKQRVDYLKECVD